MDQAACKYDKVETQLILKFTRGDYVLTLVVGTISQKQPLDLYEKHTSLIKIILIFS